MKDKTYNVTFGGTGGQGILKAAEICGWAAMLAGCHVKKSEVHGMAQRGGSVESHVRFGKKVYSPVVAAGTADVLVCFHPEEHERLKAFLKPDGIDLAEYLEKAKTVIENPRDLNVFLVGVLSAYLPVKTEFWLQAIESVFKKKYVEQNKGVFLKGRETAKL
jgi:indolepyruvate ferredoxin oxidoreductase, beta subunit